MGTMPDDVRTRLARSLYRTENLVLAPTDDSWTLPYAIQNIRAAGEHASRLIATATANDTLHPPIYVDHFVSTELNAIAYPFETSFCILLSTGSWLKLFRVFSGLLSVPSVATQIGDSSAETELNVARAEVDPLKASLANIVMPTREPVNAVRNRAADYLTTIAMEILILHELGHVRNGHLLIAPQVQPLTEIEPLPGESDKVMRQTLEWDADSHATVHAMNRLLEFYLDFEQATTVGHLDPSIIDTKVMDALYGSERRALATYILATYVLFRFMGPAAWAPQSLWWFNHPPAIVRLLASLEVININLERTRHVGIAALRGKPLVDITAQTAIEVEFGLCSLHGYQINPLDVLAPSAEMVGQYTQILGNQWRLLYPKLDCLKLGGKLAPP